MTSRTLSDEQIGTLDFQTDQLYESFRRTVRTQFHQDAVWNRELFDAFESSLNVATDFSAFSGWNRNTERAPVFDKYLLHYFLGSIPSHALERQIKMRRSSRQSEAQTDVTLDTLKRAIDDGKVSYRKIQGMVMSLADAHNFTAIVNALEYVREKYKKTAE